MLIIFLQYLWQILFPLILSIGTVFSAAGTSLFGTQRIIKYADEYYEFGDETETDIKISAFFLVILTNVIIMTITRVPAIFREYFKREKDKLNNATVELGEAIEDTIVDAIFKQDGDVAEFENDPEDLIRSDDPPRGDKAIKSMTISVETIPARTAGNTTSHPSYKVKVIETIVHDDVPLTYTQKVVKFGTASTLKFLGLCSVTFASLNTFLGSITLFEFMGGNPSKQGYSKGLEIFLEILMNGGAGVTVVSKFYSQYSYVYPATKASADDTARWVIGQKRSEHDATRWQDLKSYGVTIALSFFNIVSSPFLAFYSTQQTLYRIPFISDFDDFILYFSAGSTVSSFVNDTLSKSPAVRKTFQAWWSGNEPEREKIDALNNSNLKILKVLNGVVYFAGTIDSLATGANIVIAVVNTSNERFGWDKFNPYLFSFAAACGVSAAFVSYAFSVRRGYHEFLKHEFYDYCVYKGWLNTVQENAALTVTPPVTEINTVQNYKVTHVPTADSLPEGLRRRSLARNSLSVTKRNHSITVLSSERNGHTDSNGANGRNSYTSYQTATDEDRMQTSVVKLPKSPMLAGSLAKSLGSMFKNNGSPKLNGLSAPDGSGIKIKPVNSTEDVINTSLTFN
jgi:hypothetical protein